jgi:hypothetical protein
MLSSSQKSFLRRISTNGFLDGHDYKDFMDLIISFPFASNRLGRESWLTRHGLPTDSTNNEQSASNFAFELLGLCKRTGKLSELVAALIAEDAGEDTDKRGQTMIRDFMRLHLSGRTVMIGDICEALEDTWGISPNSESVKKAMRSHCIADEAHHTCNDFFYIHPV